jgi:hypothetical protein
MELVTPFSQRDYWKKDIGSFTDFAFFVKLVQNISKAHSRFAEFSFEFLYIHTVRVVKYIPEDPVAQDQFCILADHFRFCWHASPVLDFKHVLMLPAYMQYFRQAVFLHRQNLRQTMKNVTQQEVLVFATLIFNILNA